MTSTRRPHLSCAARHVRQAAPGPLRRSCGPCPVGGAVYLRPGELRICPRESQRALVCTTLSLTS
eukprot:13051753-Alexandrium_andersonii.AAC.1